MKFISPGSVPVLAADSVDRRWQAAGGATPLRPVFVPLHLLPGEAFQFDWNCEFAVTGSLRRRMELAHVNLAC